ncbi:hypothetical protein ON010_g5847 [Phytophthora cinnamomi]|nr:hypothetical protein ON010_g5847 [Phytophthora cinnamomi]
MGVRRNGNGAVEADNLGLALDDTPISTMTHHQSYAYLGIGDGFDHVGRRIELGPKLKTLQQDAAALMESGLAPWQVVKAVALMNRGNSTSQSCQNRTERIIFNRLATGLHAVGVCQTRNVLSVVVDLCILICPSTWFGLIVLNVLTALLGSSSGLKSTWGRGLLQLNSLSSQPVHKLAKSDQRVKPRLYNLTVDTVQFPWEREGGFATYGIRQHNIANMTGAEGLLSMASCVISRGSSSRPFPAPGRRRRRVTSAGVHDVGPPQPHTSHQEAAVVAFQPEQGAAVQALNARQTWNLDFRAYPRPSDPVKRCGGQDQPLEAGAMQTSARRGLVQPGKCLARVRQARAIERGRAGSEAKLGTTSNLLARAPVNRSRTHPIQPGSAILAARRSVP